MKEGKKKAAKSGNKKSTPKANPSKPKKAASTMQRIRAKAGSGAKRGFASARDAGLGGLLIASGVGAVGATAIRTAFLRLPFVPDALQTGPLAPAIRGAAGVAVGMFGKKFLGKHAAHIAQGVVTVELTEVMEGLVDTFLPGNAPAASTVKGLGETPATVYFDPATGNYYDASGKLLVAGNTVSGLEDEESDGGDLAGLGEYMRDGYGGSPLGETSDPFTTDEAW